MNNEPALKPIHVSELSSSFQRFLEFKRSTGFKYTGEERTLKYFERYCQEHYPNTNIPEDAIFIWINENDNRSQKTKSNHAGVMTAWAKYMFSLGYMLMRIPDIRCPRNTAFVPHIFTDQEMTAIWKTVDRIQPVNQYPNLHRCIPVLFRLLFSSGLRISEALGITADDIDFDNNVITIRHAKLDKDRWIPMSDSIASVMKKYIEGRSDRIARDAPIFYYHPKQVLTSSTVYGRFRLTLEKSGIPYEGSLRGPRLHDFRHTFAVRTMNRLSDNGNDLYVFLPVLSAYLGHASLKSTERYIRLTEDRLSTITDSMQLHLSEVFPEVSDDEEI
ncbi:MAG: tyrosine-type recombinase/integrase [Dethiobacter sp.]|jgi:integrase|nr:tyrosine-type recombinase/integrase [Dethiobacter sp.]MBS3989453.1 tyrosine-type recombinase/integrase [Dethiobacter sp.]